MNARTAHLSALALVLSLSGCASYRPVVDLRGADANRYEADLSACQQLATQVDPAAHAAAAAVAGIVLGAVLGAIVGNRHTAGQGAALYGTAAAAGGAGEGMNAQRGIIIGCLRDRGHRVYY